MKRTYPKDFINTIIQGDCLEVMKQVPDKSVDLIITSPPYNIGLDYDVAPDKIGKAKYRKWLVDTGKELLRITKDGGRLCLNLGNRINTFSGMGESIDTFEILADYKNIGWFSREIITWVKTRQEENPQSFCGSDTAWGSWLSASNPICRSFSEYIFVFHKKLWKKSPVGKSDITKKEFMDYSRNVWYFPAETKRMGHPAPFPEELPYRCIKFYSYIGDIILDPFVGSGTTMKMAKYLKRNFIGIEISPKYCEISRQRLRQEILL